MNETIPLYDRSTGSPLFTESQARSLGHYASLPAEAKTFLARYIELCCKPCQQKPEDSYSWKQPFTREWCYFTTGQIAGAFKAAGYRVEEPLYRGRPCNWVIYCRPRAEVHRGQYGTDLTPAERTELRALADAAQVAIWGAVRR